MQKRFVEVKRELFVDESGQNTSYNGHTAMNFYIEDTKTGEVRLLEECILCDMEVFDINDFDTLEAV
jgi:hypothetical protein